MWKTVWEIAILDQYRLISEKKQDSASVALPMAFYKYVYDYDHDIAAKKDD